MRVRPTNQDIIKLWSSADPTAFDDEGDFARRHLLNPAIFQLLGDVLGRHILDAGCGQGYLSRLLARQGARVTGVEPTSVFFDYALAREAAEPLGITYLQRDLSVLHEFVNAFDAAIANMVFIDIPDYESAMRNCVRALKPGGTFVVSLGHPCFEEPGENWPGKRYVAVREYFEESVTPQRYGFDFHRTLSTYLNLLIDLGCTIRRVLEPQLSPEAAQEIGNDRDVHVPSFIIIAASMQLEA
jgi:SAM-dependent methyltransferase